MTTNHENQGSMPHDRRPALIGVTTSELRLASQVHRDCRGEPARVEMALGMSYLRAVERAGGLPVVLPPLELERISPLLDRLSGVLLSGGPDLDPTAYGRDRAPRAGPDRAAARRLRGAAGAGEADARGLPILGICRGAQALNVARGGTLHQHLPEITDGSIVHRQRQPRDGGHRTRSASPPAVASRRWLAVAASLSTPFTTRASTGSVAACARSRGRTTASSRASRDGGSRIPAGSSVARRDAG